MMPMKRVRFALAGALLLPSAARAGEAPQPRCAYVELADMPLRYMGQNTMPAVDGEIDGTPAVMVLDTSAFDTQLTMNAVARRGLSTRMSSRHAGGVAGRTRLYTTRVNELAIGPVKIDGKRLDLFVVVDTTATPSYDVLVGAPFLLQTDMEFDLRAKRMRFFRPQHCDDTPLQLWKEDIIVLPFDVSRSRTPNPVFTVLVNDKEVRAAIATGAPRSFLLLNAARRIGIDVDNPAVTRLRDTGLIGSERTGHWVAPVKTVQDGEETIKDAELGIVDAPALQVAELYLGQDFLRAHRVLFAMGQRKLYLAYLGGEAFTRGGGLEPWMLREAEGGDANVQYALYTMYRNGRGVARDLKVAQAWLEKAGAAGQPNASLALARQQMLAGRYDDAITKLRAALDQLPAEAYGPLWLYNARVHQGQAGLAQVELEAALQKQHNDEWPQPIARFYTGALDAKGLLDSAAADKDTAHARTCAANTYMAEWHGARGEKTQQDALLAALRSECKQTKTATPAPRAAP
jgi:predicted aspartyl protease